MSFIYQYGTSVASQIASVRKDNFYVDYLRGMIIDLAQRLLGQQVALLWSKELQVLADFAYYALTTLSDLQTLGEEYTNIVQVGPSLRELPTIKQRIVLVTLHAFLPYIVDKLLSYYGKKLARNATSQESERLQEIVQKAHLILPALIRLNLSVFYLHGTFYSLAKRIANVRYLNYSINKTEGRTRESAFRLLGVMSLWQSSGAFILQLISLYKDIKAYQLQKSKKSQNESVVTFASKTLDESAETSKKCSLCLQNRENSTATPCGHLFCWMCIHEWVNTKAECPICREKITPNKLILLRNF